MMTSRICSSRLMPILRQSMAIEDLIQGGGVIKDVTSTAEGVTVTMSNGKEFKISNGTREQMVLLGPWMKLLASGKRMGLY